MVVTNLVYAKFHPIDPKYHLIDPESYPIDLKNVEPESEACHSPCIRHCCLDENDVCVGCYRTLSEILGWHGATFEMKIDILRRCEHRKEGHFLAKKDLW
jgi:predicted Fe-S protein YdhL (DUF1289 family)